MCNHHRSMGSSQPLGSPGRHWTIFSLALFRSLEPIGPPRHIGSLEPTGCGSPWVACGMADHGAGATDGIAARHPGHPWHTTATTIMQGTQAAFVARTELPHNERAWAPVSAQRLAKRLHHVQRALCSKPACRYVQQLLDNPITRPVPPSGVRDGLGPQHPTTSGRTPHVRRPRGPHITSTSSCAPPCCTKRAKPPTDRESEAKQPT